MNLVRFYCPEHGYLCMASPRALVRCGGSRLVKGVSRRCNLVATTVNPTRRAK